MKISVFPKGELDAIVKQTLSVPAWIASVATLPIDGVELYSGMFDGANDDALAEVADCLAEHHLVMPMLCCVARLHPSRLRCSGQRSSTGSDG